MQQIADAVGIHKATLYHYFRHKEDLFANVVSMEMRRSHEGISGIIAQGGSPEEQLVAVALQIFSRSQSDTSRLMTELHEHISPEQRDSVLQERAASMASMQQIFRYAIDDGVIPEIDTIYAVSVFLGLIWGQIWMRKIAWSTMALDPALATSLVQIMLHGMRHATMPTPIAEADPTT